MTFGAPDPTRPRSARRAPLRNAVPLALAAWAVLEIWLLTVVARAAGGGTVLLLLLAGLAFGAVAAKRAGRWAGRALTAQARGSGAPRPAGGGSAGLAMLGGLLLMVPGLVSDAAGLLCLFPPTRALIGRAAARILDGRAARRPGSLADAYRQAWIHRPDGRVVPGEVIREDPASGGPGDTGAPRPPLTR